MGASLGGTYDANAKENNQSSAVPAGDYPLVMVKSEKVDGKKPGAAFIYCEFQITAGEFQNRRIIHRFNLWNPNQEAVNIAKGQFSEFCRAVGVLNPSDSGELENKPFMGKVNAKESGDFGLQNNITKFLAKQVNPVTTDAPAQQAPATSSAW